MITAFILANNDAKALTRTLNALVVATVDGMVREVIVLATYDNDIAAKLADDAGCALISPDNFASTVSVTKGEWLMILVAGALPEQGWLEAVDNHIQSDDKAVRFTRSPLAPRSFLKLLFQAELPLALGLLVRKHEAINLGEPALSSPENLIKAAKPKAMPAALRPA
jgi:hypothetical protein